MVDLRFRFVLAASSALFGHVAIAAPSLAANYAQETPDSTTTASQEASPDDTELSTDISVEAQANNDQTALDEDNSAARLNSQQQLKQSFTFTRTIDGTVVESETRTIIYSDDDPIQSTEADATALQRLSAAFDGEVLTRMEAFEEAKVDFVIADADRDGVMTREEFTNLVITWLENDPRQPAIENKEDTRKRQYQAFIFEIDPKAAQTQAQSRAEQKFAFMTGTAAGLSQRDYITEYLVDFDAMDKSKDMLLKDDELLKFRALNRGEATEY